MPRGGVRPGQGRKSKAEELGLPMLIEDVIGIDGKKELIKTIYKQAKDGKEASQKLLMEYIFGKPTDNLKVDQEVILKWIEE